QLLSTEAIPAHVRELAAAPLGLDHPSELTGGRRLVEAEDLDRIARLCIADLLAAVVVERADLSPGIAGDDGVADAQCSAMDQHCGDRTAPDVEARLDDRSRRLGGRIRLQL